MNEIEVLYNKRSELQKQLIEVRHEIQKKELEGIDYTGKYISILTYGTMFVMSQKYDINDEDDGEARIVLRGFINNSSVSEYTDDFCLYIDAHDVWSIPVKIFNDLHRNNDIQVIEKDKFVTILKEDIKKFSDNMLNMLNIIDSNSDKQ